MLKGHRTLVTDGQTDFENETGNPGMATGGSGDVLTGITAACWAQCHAQPERALPSALAAVRVHAHSGDLAAIEGQRGLIASDIIRSIRTAIN